MSSSTADSGSTPERGEVGREGVPRNASTEESSSNGLGHVRSFGTEGRKEDGPQVPPSDKLFEYIFFRGSDIKDLQVKSSPPVQPAPATPIDNDPAIIQSHYPHPVSTSTSLPPTASGPSTNIGSNTAQMALPASNFQGGLPFYQPPGGNIGSWGAPPAPGATNSWTMPMYWQGYCPPNGLPHINQQTLLLRPSPGLFMPPSLQQPMQYPGFDTSFPAEASNLPGPHLPEVVPSPLLPVSSSSLNMTSISSAATLPSTLSTVPSAATSSDSLPSVMLNKAPTALPAVSLSANLPSLPPLMTTGPEISNIIPPISNKPNVFAGPTLQYQSSPQSTSSVLGPSNAVNPEAPIQMPTPTPLPSLITHGQLLQSGPTTTPSSQPSQIAHKDVEVVQVSPSSPKPLAPVASEAQPPILPLPPPARVGYKNGVPFQTRSGQTGCEKGRGAQVFQIHRRSNQSFRRRAGDDEDDDEELNGAAATGTKIPSKSIAAATKAPPKPKKPQAPKLLSFTDGDGDDESQPHSLSRPSSRPSKTLSSSSSSHKISSLKDHQSPATPLPSNVLPQAGTYTKEALHELQKNTKTLASSSRSRYAAALESYPDPKLESVIVLKGLVEPNSIVEQTSRQMDELNSDEEKGGKGNALEEKRDVLYRDDVERRFAAIGIAKEHDLSGSLFPDQVMMNAIRAKKEQLRQSRAAVLDYILLDGGSNHCVAEGLSDEEPEFQGRIAMFREKIEGGKKGVFNSFDDRLVDASLRKETKLEDDEDEEEKIWEEEQFRKGLGKRMDDGTSTVCVVHDVQQPQKYAYTAPAAGYGSAPSIGAAAPPPPSIGRAMVAEQGLDVMSIPQQAELAMKALCDNARRLEESYSKTMSSLAKTDENLSSSLLNITALEKSLSAAGEKYIYMQGLSSPVLMVSVPTSKRSTTMTRRKIMSNSSQRWTTH